MDLVRSASDVHRSAGLVRRLVVLCLLILDTVSDGGVIDAGSEVDASTDVDAGIDDRSQRPEYEFVPNARFHGLETINLHNGFKDPTIMHELFAYDLHAAAGNVASRTSHARVYVTVPGIFDREYFGLVHPSGRGRQTMGARSLRRRRR